MQSKLCPRPSDLRCSRDRLRSSPEDNICSFLSWMTTPSTNLRRHPTMAILLKRKKSVITHWNHLLCIIYDLGRARYLLVKGQVLGGRCTNL
jgi:hypothetical protein